MGSGKSEILGTRNKAAEWGREALAITTAKSYTTPNGRRIELGEAIDAAVRGTVSYPPTAPIPTWAPRSPIENPSLSVRSESTLMAAQRLAAAGANPVALNFASAKHPGGGFLSGARAQEESLCRSSALIACLAHHPMYAFHRERSDALYTNYAIYSPGVPVFRLDEGTLLEAPYRCAFITSPAVNAGVVLQRDATRGPEIRAAMAERIDKVLAIAAHHGHSAVILGAWGCGAFGNSATEIAPLFSAALAGRFRGVFETVVFSILDWSPERRFIGPFEQAFGAAPNVDPRV